MNGLYFLAGDSVLERCTAFLESVRQSNPDLPLCWIPFDDRCDKIEGLSGSYGFTKLDDDGLLRTCDEVGRLFFGRSLGHFRKLACWHGPFREFVFIDADTVLLHRLDELWPLLNRWDIITSHSNLSSSRRHTWKDSIYAESELSEAQIDFATNTGFFASRRNLFSLSAIRQAAFESRALAKHMELACAEQPFLNYLFVTSGHRYTSISRLRAADEWPDRWHECWPGDPKWTYSPSGHFLYDGIAKDVLFVHWAGLWNHPSGVRNCPAGPGGPIPPDLPLKSLWRSFFDRAPASTST